MNKPPAFQFYAKDWLTSKHVLKMTPSQCGYYINLLAHAWDSNRPGTLPNDPEVLWRLARAESRRIFDRDSKLVLDRFTHTRDGLLKNNRMVRERRAQIRNKKCKSIAGKAGAKSKWDKQIHGRAISLPLTESSSSSSSSSSSATKVLKPIATLWPDNFKLTDQLIEYAVLKGVPDPLGEWGLFEEHQRGKAKKWVDWIRAWQYWVRNSVKFYPAQNGRKQTVNPEARVGVRKEAAVLPFAEPAPVAEGYREFTDARARGELPRGMTWDEYKKIPPGKRGESSTGSTVH